MHESKWDCLDMPQPSFHFWHDYLNFARTNKRMGERELSGSQPRKRETPSKAIQRDLKNKRGGKYGKLTLLLVSLSLLRCKCHSPVTLLCRGSKQERKGARNWGGSARTFALDQKELVLRAADVKNFRRLQTSCAARSIPPPYFCHCV